MDLCIKQNLELLSAYRVMLSGSLVTVLTVVISVPREPFIKCQFAMLIFYLYWATMKILSKDTLHFDLQLADMKLLSLYDMSLQCTYVAMYFYTEEAWHHLYHTY